jgi:hypothetical protein
VVTRRSPARRPKPAASALPPPRVAGLSVKTSCGSFIKGGSFPPLGGLFLAGRGVRSRGRELAMGRARGSGAEEERECRPAYEQACVLVVAPVDSLPACAALRPSGKTGPLLRGRPALRVDDWDWRLTMAGILRQEHVREASPAFERIPMVPGAWPEPASPQHSSAGAAQPSAQAPRARCERKRYVDFTPAQLYKRWKQAKAERSEQGNKSREGRR